MNNKGFTLVELLATIVILGIVVSLSVVLTNVNVKKTKEKAEEVFVETIADAIKIYIDSDAKSLSFNSKCSSKLSKTTTGLVDVYYVDVDLGTVIGSSFSPLKASELVNPNNKDAICNSNAKVRIYRDDDYVYYYKMAKSADNNSIGCLTLDLGGYITNLPGGYTSCF